MAQITSLAHVTIRKPGDYQINSSNEKVTRLVCCDEYGNNDVLITIDNSVVMQLAADISRPYIERELQKELLASGKSPSELEGAHLIKIFKVFHIPKAS